MGYFSIAPIAKQHETYGGISEITRCAFVIDGPCPYK